jgi:hypothetical protein
VEGAGSMGIFRHKNNLLEWYFNYGQYFVQIKTKHKEQFLPDGLLVASYILFLARYFRICDDRQVEPMKEFLNKEIVNSESDIKELSSKIHGIIMQAFNEWEKRAVGKLFFLGLPPLDFSESEEVPRSYAKYSFLVFEQNGILTSTLHLSAGADKVFLPLTVAILYKYVVEKLMNKDDNKQILDKAILDLLRGYDKVNCRSLAGLSKLPIEIITQNNIDYYK